MSPIGRIFIVLNLVLAVAFLGWASSALASSQEYKNLYDAEVEARKADVARLEGERDAQRLEKERAENDRDANKNNLENTEASLAQAESDKDGLKEQLRVLQASFDKISQEIGEYDDRNDDLATKITELTDKLGASDDERDQFRSERDALEDEKNDLERTIAERDGEIAALKTQRTALQSQRDELQTQIATAQEIYKFNIKEISAMPHIRGAVLMTSNEVAPGLVSINRGAADNVQRGFTFEIYAGGQYKGRVRVVDVQENQCTAIVEKLYEGRTIEQGDSASTHI